MDFREKLGLKPKSSVDIVEAPREEAMIELTPSQLEYIRLILGAKTLRSNIIRVVEGEEE